MRKSIYLACGTFITTFILFSVLVNFLPIHKQIILYIAKGTSVDKIYSNLYDNGIIQDRFAFKIYKTLTGQLLKAGEFSFNVDDSPSSVLSKIHNNKYMYRKITIPEGLTVFQVISILRKNPYLTGDIVGNNADMLLPETYKFVRGQRRAVLYNTMQDAFIATVEPLWHGREKGLPFHTMIQAVTLASIVEKETGIVDERNLVASVFINRLHKGMALQSDPTTIYALSNGVGKLNRPLRRADWRVKHPFNTYYIKGLPPHPIAGVGIDSLKAVLHPIKTEYYYFVATGQGGHYFAKNLEQHNKNYKKYKLTKNKE